MKGGKTDSSDEVDVFSVIAKTFSSKDRKATLNTLKKILPFVLLAIFIVVGFGMRFYHIQYPMIGYHNWKEAHYSTEARNFERQGFFAEGFFVPMRDTMEGIHENPTGAHNDTFPTISIIVAILFKFFGESLVVARLAGIIFSVLSILVFYLFVRELFQRESLALLAAFLATINPLYVFFSHNIQLVNPALFFMLSGAYLYVRWYRRQLDKKKVSYLVWAALFVMLGTITKYTFVVIAIPIVLTFPFRKFFKDYKKHIPALILMGLIVMSFPLWYLYSEGYVKNNVFMAGNGQVNAGSGINVPGLSSLIDLSVLGDASFWQIIKSYAADNYTLLGLLFMIAGFLIFMFMLLSKTKDKKLGHTLMMTFAGAFGLYLLMSLLQLLNIFKFPPFVLSYLLISIVATIAVVGISYHKIRSAVTKSKENNDYDLKFTFTLGYLFGLVVFVIIMGFKLSGHNYHQYPIAPIILLMIAYVMDILAVNITSFIKSDVWKAASYVLVVLFLLFVIPPGNNLVQASKESADRMWNTQFPGLDIAGYYIRDHSQPYERIYHSSGQSFGVLWHADRKGYKPQMNLTLFKEGEDKDNVSWVFMYQWGIQTYFQNPEVMDYIRNNYHLVQMAFVPQQQQIQPVYFLFKKGGTFNETKLNEMLQNVSVHQVTYHYTETDYSLQYVNLE